MTLPRLSSPPRGCHRGLPAHLSSLVLLLQRSPLVKLLPEARIISTSGFTEALSFGVSVVAGLGAFDAVSGATQIAQQAPTAGSSIVNMTGGTFSTFQWTMSGNASTVTPGTYVITGQLPKGLVNADLEQTYVSRLTGTPVETGSFPVSVTLWEFGNVAGRNVTGDFTIVVAPPPAPNISAHPQGGNFAEGAFVSLLATQTSGFSFIWKKDGEPLTPDSTVLASRTAPRVWKVPATDPGSGWRSGAAFTPDATWKAASGGIGYDNNPNPVNYNTHIVPAGDVRTAIAGRTSVHIRIPFTMTGSTPVSNLKLLVQCDDGFIAWLNGTEVASQNPLTNILWNSPSGNQVTDTDAVVFREIDISRFVTALRTGENVIAVQAMNYDAASSDLLFNCELVGGIEESTQTRRLIIPAINSNQAGSYTITVTNPTGSVTSNTAVLVLPPQIEAHPASTTIPSGQTATLSVEALVSPPWTYQWFRGSSGDTSQPVSGATGASFTTPALTQSQTYWVRVTNAAGSVDSNAATVTVMSGAVPPSITTGPQSQTVDAAASAELSVSASGDAPFTYQWYTGTSGTTTGLIGGATNATFSTPPLTSAASYWVRVTNTAGSADSPAAVISIREPFLTWQMSQFTPEELSNPVLTGPAADPDGDGISNEQEYVFGTRPKDSQAALTPVLSGNGESVVLTFTAAAAAGPGYAGRTRHYAIEVAENLTAGPWTALPSFEDIVAGNQQVTAPVAVGPAAKFCRLRVWLTP